MLDAAAGIAASAAQHDRLIEPEQFIFGGHCYGPWDCCGTGSDSASISILCAPPPVRHGFRRRPGPRRRQNRTWPGSAGRSVGGGLLGPPVQIAGELAEQSRTVGGKPEDCITCRAENSPNAAR